MMSKCILIFIVIAAIAQVTSLVHGSCSYYQFETQPPLKLDCDPYNRLSDGRIIWRLRIECEVVRVTSNPDSSDAGTFDIHWFRRDPVTQEVQDLGRLNLFNPNDPPSNDKLHLEYGGNNHILNDDFREDMLGDYWCQVINTTTTPNTGLGISNILTILRPDEYSGSLETCERVRNQTVTCADFEIQQAEVVPVIETTTSLSPSTLAPLPTNQQNTVSLTHSEMIQETVFTDSVQTTNPLNRISQTNILTSTPVELRPISTQVSSTTEYMNNRVQNTNIDTSTLSPSTVLNTQNTNGVTSTTPTVTTATLSTSIVIATGTTTPSTVTMSPLVQTQIVTILPSSQVPADILISKTDTHLILAASIGGTMLILIIVLLAVVVALLCTNKNRPQNDSREDCEKMNSEMQRMSALRSSQRPLLLDSTSLSPDATQFATSYSKCESLPDHPPNTPQQHHYSVIRDSTFQPNRQQSSVSLKAQQMQSPPFVLPEMTDNQYYSTADQIISDREISPMEDNNEYSSLRPNGSDGNSTPNDGYNKLRQHTPPSPPNPAGAYSTLYDPSSMNTSATIDADQVEPYNTLSYNTQTNTGGSQQQKPQVVNGSSKHEPLFKVAAGSNSVMNVYDEVYDDSQQELPPPVKAHQDRAEFDDPQYSIPEVKQKVGNKKTKKPAMLPPNYKGDYERDPNYSYAY